MRRPTAAAARTVWDHRTFFRQFLISYFAVLAIPITTSVILYSQSERFVIDQIRAATENTISQAAGVVDRNLADLQAIVDQMAIDTEFAALADTSPPLGGRFYYRMQRVVESITAQVLTRGVLSRYFLYLPNSRYVLAMDTAYQADFFFDRAFRYPTMTPEQWFAMQDAVLSAASFLPAKLVLFQGNDLRVVPVVFRYTIAHGDVRHGFVVFLFSHTEFTSVLSRLLPDGQGSVYVADDAGTLIASVGGSDEEYSQIGRVGATAEPVYIGTTRERGLVTRVASEYSNLAYIVVTPHQYIVDQIA